MNVTPGTNDEARAQDIPQATQYECIYCGQPAADWSRVVCDPCHQKVNEDIPL